MHSWRSYTIRLGQIGMPLLAMAAVSGCGSAQSPKAGTDNGEQTVIVPKNETVTASASAGLAAAAENFEALTEQAFSAKPDELALLFDKAQESATGIAGPLGPEAAISLDGRLKDAKTAIDAGNPSEIALAAVEGYKLIVSAFPPDATIPAAVSLLDYAGFRIQADLKSDPKRWADAQQAAKYAHEQWNMIKDKVTNPDLNKRFTASLANLDAHLATKDEKMATKAAITELDLVDELEGFFQPAAKPAAKSKFQ